MLDSSTRRLLVPFFCRGTLYCVLAKRASSAELVTFLLELEPPRVFFAHVADFLLLFTFLTFWYPVNSRLSFFLLAPAFCARAAAPAAAAACISIELLLSSSDPPEDKMLL